MKHKVEFSQKLNIVGFLDTDNLTVSVGDAVIDLKEELEQFNGKEIKLNVGLTNIIAEE